MPLIPLRNRRKEIVAFAIVDAEDVDQISKRTWCVFVTKYAGRRLPKKNGKQQASLMHREILGAKKGEEVDHKNGNGLDNRKENLRLCTRSQNNMNSTKRAGTSSKFKGVYFNKARSKWAAEIEIGGMGKSLGLFINEIDAAHAYNLAAKKHFREFAKLNEVAP